MFRVLGIYNFAPGPGSDGPIKRGAEKTRIWKGEKIQFYEGVICFLSTTQIYLIHVGNAV